MEPMGVIRACDALAAAGYADNIERGPARHGISNALSMCATPTATASNSTPATT